MQRRHAVLVVAVIAAVTIVGIALMGNPGTRTDAGSEKTFTGLFTSDSDIRVANLTIEGGHVTVGYTLDVLFIPTGAPSRIRCGMVDTSGRLDFFEASRTFANSGEWTTLSFDARYDLPELTLGIRCSPSRDGALTAVFRDAELYAVAVE